MIAAGSESDASGQKHRSLDSSFQTLEGIWRLSDFVIRVPLRRFSRNYLANFFITSLGELTADQQYSEKISDLTHSEIDSGSSRWKIMTLATYTLSPASIIKSY